MTVAGIEENAYRTLVEGCGLVDRSERGKLALTGAEAKDFLHGQVTNDILGLEPGHGCYAAFLTHKGKMLGDMRVFDLGDELLLDCERVSLQELFNMIRRYKLGREVELHKRTLELAELSVIGPDAPKFAGASASPHGAFSGARGPPLAATRATSAPSGLNSSTYPSPPPATGFDFARSCWA